MLFLALFTAGIGAPAAKAAAPNFSVKGPETGWFFTSVCQDRVGRLWCGTEDRGVVWYDPAVGHWNQACAPATFDDVSVYSVVCDSRGEVWAGTLNHGVAGFGGEKWTYYNELDGLRGRRVFALAINPLDDSLWAATEDGLSRRDETNGSWSFLPLSVSSALVEPTCLTFAADGALFVGTQCDGVLIGSAADRYATFKNINGPALLPNHPQGAGLPCGMVTCLIVTADGTIWAGTTGGISCSKDKGKSWTYYCGSDWADKQADLPDAPPTAGKTAAIEIRKDTFIPSEDYITCLAEMPAGHLWIGHREQGCDELNLATMKLEKSGADPSNHTVYTMAMLPVGSHMVVATYGNGIVDGAGGDITSEVATRQTSSDLEHQAHTPAASAVPVTKPILEQLVALRNIHASPDEYKPFVAPLPDDWVTQGDWLGRYGTYWTALAATVSPHDYIWGASPRRVKYSAKLGLHRRKGDSLRYWVDSLYTDNPRVMELPTTYLQSRVLRDLTTAQVNRRESEWDDHAEAYDRCWSGANVYVTVAVPAGLFRLSTYHLDKDGHNDLLDVSRDYRISIRRHPRGVPLSNISSFSSMPELAHGRITNFCGGVWKRFVVRGPIDLTIEINKNYSRNTIICAVTLDLLDGDPPPYYQTIQDYEKRQTARKESWTAELAAAKTAAPPVSRNMPQEQVADQILKNLDRLKYSNTLSWCAGKDIYYPTLLNWYGKRKSATPSDKAAVRAAAAKLARCYFESGLYKESEGRLHAIGEKTARDIEKSVTWDGVTDAGDGYKVVSSYLDSLRKPGGK